MFFVIIFNIVVSKTYVSVLYFVYCFGNQIYVIKCLSVFISFFYVQFICKKSFCNECFVFFIFTFVNDIVLDIKPNLFEFRVLVQIFYNVNNQLLVEHSCIRINENLTNNRMDIISPSHIFQFGSSYVNTEFVISRFENRLFNNIVPNTASYLHRSSFVKGIKVLHCFDVIFGSRNFLFVIIYIYGCPIYYCNVHFACMQKRSPLFDKTT